MSDSRRDPPLSAAAAASILDTIPAAITIHDGTGRILYANRSFEAEFGFVADELVGKDVAVLLERHRFNPGQMKRIFRKAGSGDPQVVEVSARRASGASFPVEISVASGNFWGQPVCVAVFRDLTVQRRIEEQLQQAQQVSTVGRLAGGLAHDFNNVLAIVRLNAALVRTDLMRLGAGTEEVEGIEEIDRAAERARDITRQLLAFGRHQVLLPRPVSLNPIVLHITKLMRRLLSGKIEIVTALDPSIGCVNVDRNQISRVLVNLIVNARDAMPDGGRLTVRTRPQYLSREAAGAYPYRVEPGPYVVLSVSDTGDGMDAEVRDRIFEPFFTTKTAGEGTGLGLPVVYGIVKQSRGYIWVQSDPGEGTVFEIFLPFSECSGEPEEPATLPESAPPPGLSYHDRILVVEDADAVRFAVRETLRKDGYRVVECRNGEEALQIIHQEVREPFALVLTDLIMPRMGGQELTARLAAANLRPKILYMSGYTDETQIREDPPVLDAPFIAKPFSPDELREKVREVLDQPALGD